MLSCRYRLTCNRKEHICRSFGLSSKKFGSEQLNKADAENFLNFRLASHSLALVPSCENIRILISKGMKRLQKKESWPDPTCWT